MPKSAFTCALTALLVGCITEIGTAMNVGVDIMAPPGMEKMGQQLRSMFSQLASNKTQSRKITIKAACQSSPGSL